MTKRYLREFSSLGVCKRSDFPFNDSKHEKVKYVFSNSSSLFCFFICLYAPLRHAVLRKWRYTKANIGIWIGCINIFSPAFLSFLSHTHTITVLLLLYFSDLKFSRWLLHLAFLLQWYEGDSSGVGIGGSWGKFTLGQSCVMSFLWLLICGNYSACHYYRDTAEKGLLVESRIFADAMVENENYNFCKK